MGAILRNTCKRVVARARDTGSTGTTVGADSSPRISAAAAPAARLLAPTRTLPGHDVPAVGEQRRGVLEDHRQRAQRARGDQVVDADPAGHSSARALTTVTFASPETSTARSR